MRDEDIARCTLGHVGRHRAEWVLTPPHPPKIDSGMELPERSMSARPAPAWRRRRRLGAGFAGVFGDGFETVMAELFGQVLLGDLVTV
jgi:hypothetical protein